MTARRATSSMWASLLLVLIVSVGAPAHAQDTRDSALARSLFQEGVALGDRGDWVGAADRFARAHSLKPTPAVAFNWGSALMHTGHLVEARELLWKAQRDPAANEALRRECDARLEELAPRMPSVRVHVTHGNSRDDLTVEIDQRPLPRAAWDVPSPVDPGEHAVVLREDGDERARASLTLSEGEQRTITLSVPEAGTALVGASTRDEPAKKPLYKNWKLWTVVGAVAVTGIVIAVAVASHNGGDSPTRGNANPGVIRW